MSALDDIRRALSDAYGTGVALHDLTADDLIRSAVAEFEMDAEAYPGELAMYRQLVRTLRTVVRVDDADMDEVRRLLHHHASDDDVAREEAKGLTERQARLLDAIRTHGGAWNTHRVLSLYALTDPGVVQRGTARHDLTALQRAGHLVLVDDPDNRHYALNTRGGGAR
ncbi:hypothetical protein ACFC5H_09070 [Streptomyces rochei]